MSGNTPASFGDSVFGVLMGIAILVFLFLGEPDVVDATRKMIIEAAGLEYSE